jgi:hypothetical protein
MRQDEKRANLPPAVGQAAPSRSYAYLWILSAAALAGAAAIYLFR